MARAGGWELEQWWHSRRKAVGADGKARRAGQRVGQRISGSCASRALYSARRPGTWRFLRDRSWWRGGDRTARQRARSGLMMQRGPPGDEVAGLRAAPDEVRLDQAGW